MQKYRLTLCFFILFSGAALAHSGVKNPAVMARMNAMSGIGDETKVLGQMAKGEKPFDAAKARSAAVAIAGYASRTPALFEAEETDPKSETKPEVWTNFEDFSDKSRALEQIALDLADSISSPEDLGPALQKLGKSCRACHEVYREKKE